MKIARGHITYWSVLKPIYADSTIDQRLLTIQLDDIDGESTNVEIVLSKEEMENLREIMRQLEKSFNNEKVVMGKYADVDDEHETTKKVTYIG